MTAFRFFVPFGFALALSTAVPLAGAWAQSPTPLTARPAPVRQPVPGAATVPAPVQIEQPPAPAAAPAARVVPLDIGPMLPPAAAAPIARPVLGKTDGTAPGPVINLPVNKSRALDLSGGVRDIVVGNPDIADVIVHSPTQVFLMGKTVGDTNVFLLDQAGKVIRRLEINVQLDVETLRQVLREAMPDEKVQVSAVNDSVLLAGSVSSDGVAAKIAAIARRFVTADANLVNMMQIAGERQVLLKVRVAEMQRSAVKELGASNSTKGFGSNNVKLFTSATASSDPFGLVTISSLGLDFTMLEDQGLAKTLAEPNLTAISGEEATLLAGGEVAIPVSEDKDGRITAEWKTFGVKLAFTPVVTSAGNITLKVMTEVSRKSKTDAFTVGGLTLPSFDVRRATTTVELPSGGGLMIGGLLQNDMATDIQGVPGAMDLPILGTLFRSSAFQRNETELVFSVSAYVVKPVEPKKLAMPTDGFAPANDLDMYLLGRLNAVYGKGMRDQLIPNAKPQGPLGYIVE